MSVQSIYLEAYQSGLLDACIQTAQQLLESCELCPRKCKVNRTLNETGICKTGRRAIVASYSAHFGEEAPLVGTHGSGTLFFSHCNLGCNFCQNYEISHDGVGIEVSDAHLARIMIELQNRGCHNINLVTPSHVIPQILKAIKLAVEQGLEIPLVYNSSGYDSVDALKLLDGIVDIYMPDLKFLDTVIAMKTCQAPDYPEIVKKAIREMHRQVGDLIILKGVAQRGLLIRHLLMPSQLSDTADILRFIARELSTTSYVNIMDQYRPCGTVGSIPTLMRSISTDEYNKAISLARKSGLHRLA
ncbi:MAG: radical SAM protein [Bacteroidetes bacterium]|nr:radical SAM protein [Bacteroidota bacterium]